MSIQKKPERLTAIQFAERHLRNELIAAMHKAGWRLITMEGSGCDAQDIRANTRGFMQHAADKYWATWDFAECWLFFKKDGGESWVKVVRGNGEDFISDYGIALGAIVEQVYLR